MRKKKKKYSVFSLFIILIFLVTVGFYIKTKVAANESFDVLGGSRSLDSDFLLVAAYINLQEIGHEDNFDYIEYEMTSIDDAPKIEEDKVFEVEREVQKDFYQTTEYTVKEGESVWSISKNFNLSMASVITVNNLQGQYILQPGQKLKIPNISGILVQVESGDNLWSIANRHGAKISDIKNFNRLKSDNLTVGLELFIPGASQPVTPARARSSKTFIYPIRTSFRISSYYGYRIHPVSKKRMLHEGIDMAAPAGTRVYASREGRVNFVGWIRGYGKVIIINHAGGYSTRYAHLSRTHVRRGQYVEQGEIIGNVGRTGIATGDHLHFEIRQAARPVDPMKHLK